MKRAFVASVVAAENWSTKDLRHRLSPSITKNGTLSNHNSNQPDPGSVMWAEPISSGMGTRSGGTDIMTQAIDVTRTADAQHEAGSGATVAGAMMQRRVTPAAENVIEEGVDDAGYSSTKCDFGSSVTTQQRAEAYAVVRRARAVMALTDVSRIGRKDTQPSAPTIEDYERKCEMIDGQIERLEEIWEPPLKVALSQYAPKRQSFFAMRAALRWRARKRVMDSLSRQEYIQRTGILGGEWLKSIKELDRCTQDLQNITAIGLEECLAISEREPVKARSKKQALRQLKPDWRDRFLEANQNSPTYRAPVLLMRHCGMRPHELQCGVKLKRLGDTVCVAIRGAKVRETAGQPWRTMMLDASFLPTWFLDEIGMQERTISANAENMRSHLARVSNKLFVRSCREGRRDPLVSAYVFRHALTTDMRANGFSTAQMAAVLGETTEDTVAWYGLQPRGGSRPLVPVAIVRNSLQAARPVRASDRTWVASAGRGATKTKATARRNRP